MPDCFSKSEVTDFLNFMKLPDGTSVVSDDMMEYLMAYGFFTAPRFYQVPRQLRGRSSEPLPHGHGVPSGAHSGQSFDLAQGSFSLHRGYVP